jgi:hypothetical protein
MVFTSFRKYLPVPDGGLLLNRSKLPLPPLPATCTDFVRWRLTGKLLRGLRRDIPLSPDAEQVYLNLFGAAERELDARVPVAAMSALSSAIVSATNLQQVMARRRANFRELLAASRGRVLGRVLEPVYRTLPAGVSPLVFPVRVARGTRDALRRRLQEARVFCPVHWPLPRDVNRRRFPESARLAAEMMGIPLDQRYDASAMKELIDRLTFVCREFA